MLGRLIDWLLGRRRVTDPPAQQRTGHGAGRSRKSRNARNARSDGPDVLSGTAEGIVVDRIPGYARRVCKTLHDAGFEACIVGGAVRDLLLGIVPKDFDVATNAAPEQVKEQFRRAIIVGRRFRLVHVLFGRERVEVSTFRALHPHAETDVHGRVLQDNVFGSQAEDAARRDFTINALYYDPVTDRLLDYHGGVADLRRGVIRMIGDPPSRYREDPVRMLRTVRFAAKLGFTIDPATREPIRALASLMDNVPSARLFDEMLKLLQTGHALDSLHQLRAEGLHHGLLPLLDVILEQPDGERFVALALGSTDERVRTGKSVSPSFLFASLLWQQVLERWRQAQASGEYSFPALMGAIDSVLDEQADKLAIQKRYLSDIREIWSLQPRFERRGGGAPFRLLEHLRFRAAFDFLLLRAEAGEVPAELSEWWIQFVDADTGERDALTRSAPSNHSRRRRGRRPRGGGQRSPQADAPT